MNKTSLSTAVMFVATITVATAFSGAAQTPIDPADEETIVILDPISLLDQVAQGWLELPTFDATIRFDALTPLNDPIEVHQLGPLGMTQRTELGNVWSMTNSLGDQAIVLLRPDMLRAQIYGVAGFTGIEPANDGNPGMHTEYRMYREGAHIPHPGADDAEPVTHEHPDGTEHSHDQGAGEDDTSSSGSGTTGDSGGVTTSGRTPPTGTPRTRTMTVYVDSQYVSFFGGLTWPDYVRFVIWNANVRFAEVGITYDLRTLIYDGTFTTSNIDSAIAQLRTKDFQGSNIRGYMSHKDFSGCTIGLAGQPDTAFVIQHKGDNCHSGVTPDSDFERIYLTKHELGHNNNADHGNAWSPYDGLHRHRSIMLKSAWYHYHDTWSTAECNAMRTYWGKTPACV